MDSEPITALEPLFSEISTMKRRDVFSGWTDRDKADVIFAIEDGWTDQEILELLPHLSRGSITAFRAHVTRGTYEQGDTTWKSRTVPTSPASKSSFSKPVRRSKMAKP